MSVKFTTDVVQHTGMHHHIACPVDGCRYSPDAWNDWRQPAPPNVRAAIVADATTLGGTPRFDGTRLGIDTILGWLTSNVPGAVEESFPYLPDGWYRLLVALRPFLRREYRQAVRHHEDLHPAEDDR